MSIRLAWLIVILSPGCNRSVFWIVQCGKKPSRVNSGVLNFAPKDSSKVTISICKSNKPKFSLSKTTSVVPSVASLFTETFRTVCLLNKLLSACSIFVASVSIAKTSAKVMCRGQLDMLN